MVKVKYKGGVNVRTPFGLASNGDVLEVPEKVAENLSAALWEIEKPAEKKDKKENPKGDK